MRFEAPPILQGAQVEQLAQMHSFLFQLSERLNVAMQQLDSGTAVDPQNRTLNTIANGRNSVVDVAKSFNELRALIANTGKIVKNEINIIEGEIERTSTSLSADIGTAKSDMNTQLEGVRSTLSQEIETVSSDFGTF